jgi:hypothetical protein
VANADVKKGEIIYDNPAPDVYLSTIRSKAEKAEFNAVFQKGDVCYLDDIKCSVPSRMACIFIRKNEKLALICAKRGQYFVRREETENCCINTVEDCWDGFQRACVYFKWQPNSAWAQDKTLIFWLTQFIRSYFFAACACSGGAKLEYGYLFDVFAGHINHSCRPNCDRLVLPGRIVLFAQQDISKNTEITISYYGETPPRLYGNLFDRLGFECRCGHDDLHVPYPFTTAAVAAAEITIPPKSHKDMMQWYRRVSEYSANDARFCYIIARNLLLWHFDYGEKHFGDVLGSISKQTATDESYQWAVNQFINFMPDSVHARWLKYHYLIVSGGATVDFAKQYCALLRLKFGPVYGVEWIRVSLLLSFEYEASVRITAAFKRSIEF